MFIVSDSVAVRDSVSELVSSAGLRGETFASLREFLSTIDPGTPGCLVFDAHVADLRDPQSQARLASACATRPGVLITERGDVPMAVRALKAGALDVVQKPYRDENLLESIKQALEADAVARG